MVVCDGDNGFGPPSITVIFVKPTPSVVVPSPPMILSCAPNDELSKTQPKKPDDSSPVTGSCCWYPCSGRDTKYPNPAGWISVGEGGNMRCTRVMEALLFAVRCGRGRMSLVRVCRVGSGRAEIT